MARRLPAAPPSADLMRQTALALIREQDTLAGLAHDVHLPPQELLQWRSACLRELGRKQPRAARSRRSDRG